jgi:hypothetical protein
MESKLSLQYNTQRGDMSISEYGRIVHDYVTLICKESDRTKRTKMAFGLVAVLENLTPSVKEQEDYKQKLWDHLFIISDFKLDVDAPYPVPLPEAVSAKPDPIPYPGKPIHYRFYGRNLQKMVEKAVNIEDTSLKQDFLSLLASFMKNSSRSWNSEELSNEIIVEHLRLMSKGKLSISPEDLEIKVDASFVRKPQQPTNVRNHKYSKNYGKNKRNKNRYR